MDKFINSYLVITFILFNMVFGYINHKSRKKEPPVVEKYSGFGVLGSARFLLLLVWFVAFFLAEGYRLKLLERFTSSQNLLFVSKSIGLILYTMGGIFILWGRSALGEWFSNRLVIKEGHRIIQRGPYKRMRHPIYLGVVLSFWGLALALDSLVTFLILALPFLVLTRFLIKAEERFLLAALKEDYHKYQTRLPRFFPKGKNS